MNNSKTEHVKLYKSMVELIFEYEGHISEKQRKILDKKIEEWNLSREEAKKIEKEAEEKIIKPGVGKKKSILEEVKHIIKDKVSKQDTDLYEKADMIEENPNGESAVEDISELITRGRRLIREGRYEEALECYDRYLNIESEDMERWHEKGEILKKLGQYEEGLNCYNKALEINPTYLESLIKKGELLVNQKKIKEAKGFLNRALEVYPNNKELQGLKKKLSSME
ncbi:MAG TPA: tetratricopeptide repeat protein [Candidatus Eremiobacteraeota bacterium]|nr:MAG: Photosystem I assembly protein Ycf3 [bacterium ADurb.Bin363]HPZ09268.1 tetratricopeptide repeat protein [Candidatus Eremiobacteraeota bacterium]